MIDFTNEKVVLLPQGIPFFKSVPKKEQQILLTYLYYYYHFEEFQRLLPSEKQDLILTDYTPNFNLEAHRDIIKKYESLILTPTEKLAISLKKRIEKITDKLDETEVDITDLEQEGRNMKALTEIFKLQDILDAKLAKEGGGKQGKGSKVVNVNEETTFDDI